MKMRKREILAMCFAILIFVIVFIGAFNSSFLSPGLDPKIQELLNKRKAYEEAILVLVNRSDPNSGAYGTYGAFTYNAIRIMKKQISKIDHDLSNFKV